MERRRFLAALVGLPFLGYFALSKRVKMAETVEVEYKFEVTSDWYDTVFLKKWRELSHGSTLVDVCEAPLGEMFNLPKSFVLRKWNPALSGVVLLNKRTGIPTITIDIKICGFVDMPRTFDEILASPNSYDYVKLVDVKFISG